jgi:KAP family P-loop domain
MRWERLVLPVMEAPDAVDLSPLEHYSVSATVRDAIQRAYRIAEREELPGSIGTGLLLIALYERGGERASSGRYAPLELRKLIEPAQPGLASQLPPFFEAERAKTQTHEPRRRLSNKLVATFADADTLPKHDGILAARHLLVALLRYRDPGPIEPNAWRLLAQAGVNRQQALLHFVRDLANHGPTAEREGWATLAQKLADVETLVPAPHEQLNAPPSLQMLSDAALSSEADDRLGYGAYAEGLADVIGHDRLETPFTLAINAPWGAGKTSLANLMELKLQANRGPAPPHVICRFNAWMHDDAPKLSTAFAAAVARTADRARPWYRRALRPAPLGFASGSKLMHYLLRGIPLLILGLFALCALGGLIPQQALVEVAKHLSEDFAKWCQSEANASTAAKFSGYAATAVVLLKGGGFLMPAASAVSDFVKSPDKVAAEGGLAEIAEQLGRLIREATRGKRRFVIFVDDLERCQPPRAVEVLEVINQLVAHRDVVTVELADMPAVTACAEIKYEELAKRYTPNDGLSSAGSGGTPSSYGRLYIQKVIQLQFDLPPLDRTKLKALAKALATSPAPTAADSNLEPAAATTLGKAAAHEPLTWRDSLRALLVMAILFATIWLSPGWVMGSIILVGLVAAAGNAMYQSLRRRRHKERVDEIDQGIRDELKKGAAFSPEHLQAKLKKGGDQKDADLVRERARLLIVDESAVRQQVEQVLTEYIAPLPRYAKRAINRARFAIGVAFTRRLFERDAVATADRIGKWVCLLERWPGLAQGLIRRPGTIAQLELAATHNESAKLARLLAELSPAHQPDKDLQSLLARAPLFGNSLEGLIRFEAEPGNAPAPSHSGVMMSAERQPAKASS